MNKYRLNKFCKIIYCILIIAILSIVMVGCNVNESDIGDFSVSLSSYSDTYTIKYISKSAQDKKELTIPTMINGKRVDALGVVGGPSLKSPTLKKLFWSGGQNFVNTRIVSNCTELDTVVLTSVNPKDYKQFFTEAYSSVFIPSGHPAKRNMRIVMLDSMKKQIISDDNYNDYYIANYIKESPSPNIYYYYNYPSSPNIFFDDFKKNLENFWLKISNDEEVLKLSEEILGNFTLSNLDNRIEEWLTKLGIYFSENNYSEEIVYNLEQIFRGGYVWMDYLEVGDKIITIPIEPTREGFKFNGWYLDEKCTIKADLNSIEKCEDDISFYAGWEKIVFATAKP